MSDHYQEAITKITRQQQKIKILEQERDEWRAKFEWAAMRLQQAAKLVIEKKEK